MPPQFMTKTLKWVNRNTLNEHRNTVEGVIKDMPNENLIELWETMGELGVIVTKELSQRGFPTL